jgi:beta,beta-carotene 9',10'-dioxygenase
MSNQFKGGLKTQSHEIVVEELAVEGNIPEWLVGSLIRNTPAQYEIKDRSYRHWFDGLAMLHSFAFEQGRISYFWEGTSLLDKLSGLNRTKVE